MNLPNKLTLLRVVLIPFFVLFMKISPMTGAWARWVALVIFVAASVTDLLDGKIARKYNLVTDFGKFMDPLADKLLVCSALILFVDLGRMQSWIVIIIIAREFIISGFRLIAAEKGKVIAAGIWGKLKTAVTMVTIIIMIPAFSGAGIHVLEQILIYLSLALTILSLIDYLSANRDVLDGEV
ncbi:MAG: CDP-diacylglycerol--glycerol-3-phosphate 3-phosphatidyltransferase [Lachnospiraceae bacterium]|nr:CDP-diacylglycerol--glycerol-3-phosphate 3-phosphatidyltransferase [Lachnospiraceae bacterium]